jgi:hypothetical protein
MLYLEHFLPIYHSCGPCALNTIARKLKYEIPWSCFSSTSNMIESDSWQFSLFVWNFTGKFVKICDRLKNFAQKSLFYGILHQTIVRHACRDLWRGWCNVKKLDNPRLCPRFFQSSLNPSKKRRIYLLRIRQTQSDIVSTSDSQ